MFLLVITIITTYSPLIIAPVNLGTLVTITCQLSSLISGHQWAGFGIESKCHKKWSTDVSWNQAMEVISFRTMKHTRAAFGAMAMKPLSKLIKRNLIKWKIKFLSKQIWYSIRLEVIVGMINWIKNFQGSVFEKKCFCALITFECQGRIHTLVADNISLSLSYPPRFLSLWRQQMFFYNGRRNSLVAFDKSGV